jgi:hypothetical protein
MENDITLKLIQDAYIVLKNPANQWPGRHTSDGQGLLCCLRNHIAEATGKSIREVQDDVETTFPVRD